MTPLRVILGEKEYEDGINITPDEIYLWSDEHKATPKTSAPSITDAMKLMQTCGADGSDIICFPSPSRCQPLPMSCEWLPQSLIWKTVFL